jgi:hypothetical protein
MTSQLGRTIYDEVRKYVVSELGSNGLSSSVSPLVIPGVTVNQSVYNSKTNPELSVGTESSQSLKDTLVRAQEEDKTLKDAANPEPGMTTRFSDRTESTDKSRRLNMIDSAYRAQVLFIVGKEDLQIPEASGRGFGMVKNALLSVFLWMKESTGEKVNGLKIPRDKLIEIGFIRDL